MRGSKVHIYPKSSLFKFNRVVLQKIKMQNVYGRTDVKQRTPGAVSDVNDPLLLVVALAIVSLSE